MGQYKDFTQYNAEAENIRPTAKIQLIQRILNAANLISSLGNGIPLRWASAYKSFQVLKYSENQDPTDVTTSAAVSAVDSILHEAESQLRASYDDMNTLKKEFNNIPTTCSLSYWSDTAPELRVAPNSDGYFLELYKGSGRIIGMYLNNVGILSEAFNCTPQEYEGKKSLRPNAIVSYIANGISNFKIINANSISNTFTAYFALGATVDQAYDLNTDKNIIQVEYTGAGAYDVKYHCSFNNSSLGFYGTITETSGNKTPVSVTGNWNLGQTATGALKQGNLNVDETLGLPDPTDLINILDQM